MGAISFPLTAGDSFVSVRQEATIKFLGVDVEEGTMMFAVSGDEMGFVATIGVGEEAFYRAYDVGDFREVPGAGNVREVVGESPN